MLNVVRSTIPACPSASRTLKTCVKLPRRTHVYKHILVGISKYDCVDGIGWLLGAKIFQNMIWDTDRRAGLVTDTTLRASLKVVRPEPSAKYYGPKYV